MVLAVLNIDIYSISRLDSMGSLSPDVNKPWLSLLYAARTFVSAIRTADRKLLNQPDRLHADRSK